MQISEVDETVRVALNHLKKKKKGTYTSAE